MDTTPLINSEEYQENRRLYFETKNNPDTTTIPLIIRNGKHYVIHSQSGTYMEFDDEQDYIEFMVDFEHDGYYSALAGEEVRQFFIHSPHVYYPNE